MKTFQVLSLLLLFVSVTTIVVAQSTDATISGVVIDPASKVIPDADIEILNEATGVHYSSQTNDVGIYTISILPPGQYRVQVSKAGFKTLIKPGIVLNVQSALALNFTLPVGATSESITVEAGVSEINTTDGSVSTVIDGEFVKNIPLNGRSFQDLILLTPGVDTNTPQKSSFLGQTGEFSVNGQRTESNYYTVDGVSANISASDSVSGGGPSGSLPASTALGTTQALVSVDALQEFRVESSSYSAEYGRNPGGQFAMVTRSGTNEWHGSTFEYFRNDVLDANNWFNDNTDPITPKSAERQNDFGGTVGGPVVLPHLYHGRDRTFFFASYEGLRLVQPQAVTTNFVPGLALRAAAPTPLSQVLNAYPLPTPNTPSPGYGLAEFVAGWSTPAQIDSFSLRVDQMVGKRTQAFLRYSQTPSSLTTRGNSQLAGGVFTSPSVLTDSTYEPRTLTLGVTTALADHMSNDFRANLSTNANNLNTRPDNFGGAQPVDLAQLEGLNTEVGFYSTVSYDVSDYGLGISQGSTSGFQRQWNVVDSFSVSHGRHALKAGVDWRRLSPLVNPGSYANYLYFSQATLAANKVDLGYGESAAKYLPLYSNFSAFIQDEWRVSPRLNLSLGVRWDVNPAPGVTSGLLPYTVAGLNDLSTATLAPQGTPLWSTSWYNFAPRLGFAYILHQAPERELVIRGGGGVFYDTGQQTGSYGFNGPGFSAYNFFGTYEGVSASFPVAPSAATPQIINPPTAPYRTNIYANPQHFQLPYTFQWNASLEQALGRSQSLNLSYVGANGRRLIEEAEFSAADVNPALDTSLVEIKNGLTSSYNALQVKFMRQISHGLHALASYTWSHSLDFGSYNAALPYEHGNSDEDVRNNFSAAASYDLPGGGKSSFARAAIRQWGIDGRLAVRSGFPITLNGSTVTDTSTGQIYYGGLNLVPDTPVYLFGPEFPGARKINPAAFSLPAEGEYGNAPRNFARGFGAAQTDLALRREFTIRENLKVQFRAEGFNILNRPNFGTINPYYGNLQFGEATTTLAQSLGVLSPLYQMGGPRSLQLALKLTF